MSNETDYEDIIMEDIYNQGYTGLFPSLNFFKKPHKRTYLEMLNDSKQLTMNNRFDNYRMINRKSNTLKKFIEGNNINSYNNEKNQNLTKDNNNIFSDFNKANKNLIVKKKLEYDEEKEKRFVENYYKIKNAELNKLRFGTE